MLLDSIFIDLYHPTNTAFVLVQSMAAADTEDSLDV